MVKVAVVGASENLGREILGIFSENDVSVEDVIALEPKSPLGTLVSYGEDEDLDVLNLDEFDFSKADVAIFACSLEVAKRYLPKAIEKNIKIIDCSGATATDENVPMIVAGLNDTAVHDAKKNVVSIPSAIVTQILKPLSKVNEKYSLVRIVSSAYLSTSFHSREAMDELFSQTRKIYMNAPIVDDEEIFKKQIAFNVLPQVGEFIGEETQAEWSVNVEIKKVLGGNMKVHANLAYVPVFIGAGVFVNVQTAKEVDVDDVRALMKETRGIVVFDKQLDGGYVSLNDVQGENDIYVSRLRTDLSVENGFSFWSVADNLRADCARNAFDVMKLLFTK
ncbi:MAG: aspartate-semialdehyde dehydrogenase [Alphaproteobacteria bacterium]|nr:aspartate-semialdehyde dehydrogenase [Alphaproteobacteria bacterium]